VLQPWVIHFLYIHNDPAEFSSLTRPAPERDVAADALLALHTELVEICVPHQFSCSNSNGVTRWACHKSASDRLSRHPSGSPAVQRRGPGCMQQQDGRCAHLPCAARAAGTDTELRAPQVTREAIIRVV